MTTPTLDGGHLIFKNIIHCKPSTLERAFMPCSLSKNTINTCVCVWGGVPCEYKLLNSTCTVLNACIIANWVVNTIYTYKHNVTCYCIEEHTNTHTQPQSTHLPARGGQYNGHAGHPLDIDQLQWTQMTPCVTVTQSLQSKFEFYN